MKDFNWKEDIIIVALIRLIIVAILELLSDPETKLHHGVDFGLDKDEEMDPKPVAA